MNNNIATYRKSARLVRWLSTSFYVGAGVLSAVSVWWVISDSPALAFLWLACGFQVAMNGFSIRICARTYDEMADQEEAVRADHELRRIAQARAAAKSILSARRIGDAMRLEREMFAKTWTAAGESLEKPNV